MRQDKQMFRTVRRELSVTALCLIALGLFLVIFPSVSAGILCMAVGVFACLWGVLRIVAYFRSAREQVLGSFGLVQGAGLLLIGGVILLRPEILTAALNLIFGVLLIVDGILKLQYAMDLSRLRAQRWWLVALGALATIVLGVVVILNPFTAALTLMIFAGGALIAGGLLDLLSIGYVSKIVRQLDEDE